MEGAAVYEIVSYGFAVTVTMLIVANVAVLGAKLMHRDRLARWMKRRLSSVLWVFLLGGKDGKSRHDGEHNHA